MKPEERIICALDFAEPDKAKALVNELDGLISFFKVGMILHYKGGRDIVKWLLDQNKKVFLDMKYYDIPETVAGAVKQVAADGVSLLTIHGNSSIIKMAAEARGSSSLRLLAVTVLTTMDSEDMPEMGLQMPVEKLVMLRARQAVENGCDGLIASGKEAARLKKELGQDVLVITPGIRPRDEKSHEHRRPVTPEDAIKAGADYLVVGRPIYNAPHPVRAAEKIIAEVSSSILLSQALNA